ncbi:ankyrin repeat domain-containing protein [Plantactinospora sp. KLBMP9567]|uniref:ankyrin repeat domain-containing protein n=1 Tax=Plantactinospora sp. KLBMP9567 TaxID=3085900 RepID=UPI00298123F2|nr:ankyrin repeat domain-containing protein [Plantactinospora sp. KLBMP9567]MDW5328147.1 ankyrin repeat domain-containing protein [Plantactinospora sp. KLBMP9567]
MRRRQWTKLGARRRKKLGKRLAAAVLRDDVPQVVALLAYGADPDRREDSGTGATPLDRAVHAGHRETAELLRATTGSRRPDRSPCS